MQLTALAQFPSPTVTQLTEHCNSFLVEWFHLGFKQEGSEFSLAGKCVLI